MTENTFLEMMMSARIVIKDNRIRIKNTVGVSIFSNPLSNRKILIIHKAFHEMFQYTKETEILINRMFKEYFNWDVECFSIIRKK